MKTASFVAEISSNHNRDIKRCIDFIMAASAAGCSAVKFQLFKIEELFAPEALRAFPELGARAAWELPAGFLPGISKACRQEGMLFSCTPFYLKAVDELYPFVDFYKIASYELLWTGLLSECAKTGKPIVLSTGMADMNEIEKAVDALASGGCADITLLHCVSDYPAMPRDCNLNAIETLRSHFNVKAGWSDHTVSPAVIYRAVHRWGAQMVEFHMDLDGSGYEFRTGHCWLPEQIGEVIKTVNTGFGADGDGQKGPSPPEAKERGWRADPTDGLRPLVQTRKGLERI